MSPNEQELLALLGYIYLQHSLPEKAATLFTALDILCPNEPHTLASLACAQIRSGQARQALATLDRLAITGEIDAAFHLMRTQALSALGSHQEAQDAMQAYLKARQAERTGQNPRKSG